MVLCHLHNITCSTNFPQAQQNKKIKHVGHIHTNIPLHDTNRSATRSFVYKISNLILYHTHQNTPNQTIHCQHVHATASAV
jgi:hypothetical protein